VASLFRIKWLLLALVIVVVVIALKSGQPRGQVVAALPESQVELTAEHDGQSLKLANGTVYRVVSESEWEILEQVFDPEVVFRMWKKEGEQIFRLADDGTPYPIRVPLGEDFEDLHEGVNGLRELIGPKRMWTELTVQTDQTPAVSDYVKLRQKILKGEADFLDARVEPLAEAAHTGTRGLRCFCPAPTSDMICAKSSLATGLLHFQAGQTLWLQGWYRVVGKRYPHTITDIECSYALESPGPRLCLGEDGYLEVELKALSKPRYQQDPSKRVQFPTDQWVCVTAEFQLDHDHGTTRVWQDDQLVIEGTGPNLPFPSAILDRLEIGISAHSYGDEPAVLDVDDLRVTREPLR
jgi:hypothetical protein